MVDEMSTPLDVVVKGFLEKVATLECSIGQLLHKLSVSESRVLSARSREPGTLRADLECLLDDLLDDPDEIPALREKVLAILCKHLGHEPRKDQCGKPEHDYCDACGETLPDSAKR